MHVTPKLSKPLTTILPVAYAVASLWSDKLDPHPGMATFKDRTAWIHQPSQYTASLPRKCVRTFGRHDCGVDASHHDGSGRNARWIATPNLGPVGVHIPMLGHIHLHIACDPVFRCGQSVSADKFHGLDEIGMQGSMQVHQYKCTRPSWWIWWNGHEWNGY